MPNLADLSTATKVLLGAGVLMFIDLFLSWQKVCVSAPGFPETCGTRSGWAGWGTLVGLLVIALIVWEGITLAGIASNLNVPVAASIVSAGASAASRPSRSVLTSRVCRAGAGSFVPLPVVHPGASLHPLGGCGREIGE